jgi:imidazolonepropionase-like amidohydrolase
VESGQQDNIARIAKGMDPDLVVLDADPAADVAAFAKVHQVIRQAKVVYPAP